MNARRSAVTALLGLTVLGASTAAYAEPGAAGTGTVVDTLTTTVLPGGLTLAGAGANVALSTTPGSFSPAAGATLLTMTDTTGTTNGWTVTATYSAPALGAALGGSNVKVSTGLTAPDPIIAPTLGAAGLSPANEADLSSPVAVASTGSKAGTGVSTAVMSYQVRVPAAAQVGEVYGATVTYTIASIR